MTKELQVVVVRDKNIELAVDEGINMLGVTKNDVEIEVLDPGKKGFLGIGKRMAKVKLVVKNKEKENSKDKNSKKNTNESSLESLFSNKILKRSESNEIISLDNFRIKLKKLYNGKYPVVKGDNYIKFFENGQLLHEPFVLTENNCIEYRVMDVPPENDIKVTVSPDKLQVYLEIKKRQGLLFEPIILSAIDEEIDFIISTIIIKELEPEEITIEDIYWKLEELKICYGIQVEEIEKALNNPGKEYLIAEGIPPVGGFDAWIEYLYEDNYYRKKLQDSRKSIDYFSLNNIYSVNKGEIVAVKHPAQKGINGVNVYGKKIKVAEVKDIEWRIGDGIKIIANNAVADKAGRPTFSQGKLVINETYVVNGDVDISIGNIKVYGDVFVIGNVCENFRIEATGMIKVVGNVTQAELRAEGDILVKGRIINSRIIAGGLTTFYQELYKMLNIIKDKFEELLKAIEQLKSFNINDLQEDGEKHLIQLLIDTKYKDVLIVFKSLYNMFEDNEVNKEYMLDELVEMVEILKGKITVTGRCSFRNTEEIISINNMIKDVCTLLENLIGDLADIWTTYIQSSDIRASGSVLIANDGVYNTNIYSGKKVLISGKPGVFRGGNINAGGDIFIRDLGSPGGSKVEIQVPVDCKIEAEKVFSNVSIKIGEQCYKFNVEQNNISAHIGNNGDILLFS